MSKIDTQTETRIVAQIARGDTYTQIQSDLEREGINVTTMAISDVKKRNGQALSYIQQKLADHEISKTTRILEKTRAMIEKRLEAADGNSTQMRELIELRDEGLIDDDEYAKLSYQSMRANDISIKDLTTVSKEMFTQSQIEAGKPTSITESPEQAKQNLRTLLAAINSGKEEDIVGAIFLDA